MIYFDHSATTAITPEVQAAMLPFFSEQFGNPSSVHQKGREARQALDSSTFQISKILECNSQEIIFTSGGTESNNLAIQGITKAKGKGHIISTNAEHPSVYKVLEQLEQKDFSVTYLKVDSNGLVQPEQIKEAIQDNTILVSIHYVNSETGTIQPITKIGRICEKYSIPFHVDAVQATNYLDISVQKLKCNLLSLSAHKIYGPKGVGLLYKKNGVKLQALFFGGGQEHQLRSGTENVSGIIGFAKALEITENNKEENSETVKTIRDYFVQEVLEKIPGTRLNGIDLEQRAPHNANIFFPNHNAESLLIRLDMKDICVSAGSACSAQAVEASSSLLALGLSEQEALSSLRFSFGKDNTKEEVDTVVKVLEGICKR